MQAELHQRVEALAAARLSLGKDVGPGDEDSDGEAPYVPATRQWHQQAAAVVASAQATPAVSVQAGGPSGSQLADGGGGGRDVSEVPAGSAATGPSLDLDTQHPVSDTWAPPPGGGAVTAADWADWLQQRRFGLRRPLGGDFLNRRYW